MLGPTACPTWASWCPHLWSSNSWPRCSLRSDRRGARWSEVAPVVWLDIVVLRTEVFGGNFSLKLVNPKWFINHLGPRLEVSECFVLTPLLCWGIICWWAFHVLDLATRWSCWAWKMLKNGDGGFIFLPRLPWCFGVEIRLCSEVKSKDLWRAHPRPLIDKSQDSACWAPRWSGEKGWPAWRNWRHGKLHRPTD